MSGPGRSKKDLGEQSREEVTCTMVKDISTRALAWVWALILSLPLLAT